MLVKGSHVLCSTKSVHHMYIIMLGVYYNKLGFTRTVDIIIQGAISLTVFN